MSVTISLSPAERKSLLFFQRHGLNSHTRQRAHIILLLATGFSWSLIEAALFTSSSTIARWQQRFQTERIDGLFGPAPGPSSRFGWQWVRRVRIWVTEFSPRTFGLLRSRWTCATVVVLLLELHQLRVSRETVRRWLHQENLVWRRPRPVLRPQDPRRASKLRALRQLLRQLPVDEVAVFEDEVDINTNPKIGSMWMARGQQETVETPGNNSKRYLAGSVNWRTGTLIVTEGEKRNADLFLAHLDELRRRFRLYRKIHVICDNACFHKAATSKKVQAYLAKWGDRIVLHYLPTYAPETNPIERLWWHLHEEVTRNHRCQDMEELLELTLAWLENRNPCKIEGSVYPTAEECQQHFRQCV